MLVSIIKLFPSRFFIRNCHFLHRFSIAFRQQKDDRLKSAGF